MRCDARYPTQGERPATRRAAWRRRRSRRVPRRQRNDGSGPTHNDDVAGAVDPAMKSMEGHVISRDTPSTRWTVGRVCWRSMRSARSMRPNARFASSCSESTATAPAPAIPASIHPESVTTRIGSRSSGHVSTSSSGAIGQLYVLSRRVQGCEIRRAHRCPEHLDARARCALGQIEGHGFDWISIWDHFYAADATFTPRGSRRLGLARGDHVTHRAGDERPHACTCGTLVYSSGYRHPAVLANAMATVDQLAAAASARARRRMAPDRVRRVRHPLPPAPVRLRQVAESIQCIRALFTEEVANFEGEFFQLRDARCDPKPVQARLPLWLGGGGEKVTLKLVARYADGWNVPFVVPRGVRAQGAGAARALRGGRARRRRDRVHREPRARPGETKTSRPSSAALLRPSVRTCSSGARKR